MRPKKPVIGINTDFRSSAKSRAHYSQVHAGYYDRVYAAGGIPLLIPPLTKEQDLEAILSHMDGLILIGGGDLDPKRMGQPRHPAVNPVPARREDSDRLLCRLAIENRMPLLGIALGMQLMNVVLGGALYMHLPEDLPRALPHHDPLDNTHRHAIEVTPGTRLEQIYGGGEVLVNSTHHQAVRRVASCMRVSAVAPDGVIEAIEHEDPDWFCVGVQWHPESESASALDMQLFESLTAAAGGEVPLSVAA
jgi:putative glutamine amidotransferase